MKMKKKLSVKLPAVDQSTSAPRSFGAWADEADLQVVDLDPEDLVLNQIDLYIYQFYNQSVNQIDL